ncbi:MAG: ABC transporter ATP-binding protein [Syntrophales bacterium]|jgi:branched-chain amino acid transport system ATP-binding protein|nr:ABC transporter ATP-binding protein [Syntrophales bacterium]
MLRVENLNVSYGLVNALYDVSFNIEEGECVALLGSKGAGKTTVLNTVSGLLKATSGNIFFNNEDVSGFLPHRRVELNIIQVPEDGRVFPFMTVAENLLAGASGTKKTWESRKASFQHICSIFPVLEARADLHARYLNREERQILAVGRALMAHPRLLMIDEPSTGLSPLIAMEIYTILRVLNEEGVTILLAERNIQQALEIAARGYVLENGRVVLEGSSKELMISKHLKKHIRE